VNGEVRLTGFLLGQTERITGMVTVTNLPSRPAPVLARTLTSLSALSGGRIILGIGAGAIWDKLVKLGIPRLDGGSAVRAMAEAITLIRALSGGGDPVTFDGEFYHVSDLDPATAPAPATRDEDGRWIGGSVQQWVDELTTAVLEHHAAGFIYRNTDDTPVNVALARWATEIVPAVREVITR
jgi:alkanesulfonate monooxygenase SsuD/methylene tetrahydromethanopterin reductase-like flavin-dependent oxidoreductase (luciferase family)